MSFDDRNKINQKVWESRARELQRRIQNPALVAIAIGLITADEIRTDSIASRHSVDRLFQIAEKIVQGLNDGEHRTERSNLPFVDSLVEGSEGSAETPAEPKREVAANPDLLKEALSENGRRGGIVKKSDLLSRMIKYQLTITPRLKEKEIIRVLLDHKSELFKSEGGYITWSEHKDKTFRVPFGGLKDRVKRARQSLAGKPSLQLPANLVN